MSDILFKDESFQIMGACFEVHNVMGSGFVEPVYQECLTIELGLRGILFDAKRQLILNYKDHQLEQKYIPDFVCYEKIIVEIKAVENFCDEHRAQVLNYLHATGDRLALLVNFGTHPKLRYERLAL
jgi:GxxExxY protein